MYSACGGNYRTTMGMEENSLLLHSVVPPKCGIVLL